jgi:hypothetical protein
MSHGSTDDVKQGRQTVAKSRTFGSSPVDAVAIVEAPVSQWYIQRARVAFLVVGLVSGLAVAAAVAAFSPLALAVVLGLLAGAVCGFSAAVLVRVWPVLRVLWWWLIEIALAAALVLGPAALARATGPGAALTAVGLVLVICAAVAPVRRWLVAAFWCVAVRHRLRLCFAHIVRGSVGVRPGTLPLVLWARPTPAGARVWLWLRPGLELADLDDKCGRIAVACWANQARVVAASEKYAAFIRVDLSRRDPLTGRVGSPLALLIPRPRKKNPADASASPAVAPAGLDLADIPEPPVEPPARGGRR